MYFSSWIFSEEIYMEQPIGFFIDSSLVCRFKKFLCALKQTSRVWYEKIDHLFVNLGFKQCESNHNIYVLHVHGDTLIVKFYVDDLVTAVNNVNCTLGLKRQLVDTFEMIDLSLLHFFLSIQILKNDDSIFLY